MSNTTDQPTKLEHLINHVVKLALAHALDDEIDRAIKRVEERRDEIVTGAILDVIRSTEIQDMQDRLVITLKKEGNKY